MRTLILKSLCSASLVAFTYGAAANQASVDSYKQQFAGVRAPELPAKAASLVAAANPADRAATAQDVVRAAIAVNPSSGAMVVGKISQDLPDTAAASAVAAASAQPKQLTRVTRAAVGAAPSQVEGIVTELTKAHPVSFYAIGTSALDLAPKSGEAILRGIASATPALKSLIERANPNGAAKNAAGVATVLKRVQNLVAAITKSGENADTVLSGELSAKIASTLPTSMGPLAANPPTVGPPYVPGGPTAGEISTSQTVEAPPHSRDYSTP